MKETFDHEYGQYSDVQKMLFWGMWSVSRDKCHKEIVLPQAAVVSKSISFQTSLLIFKSIWCALSRVLQEMRKKLCQVRKKTLRHMLVS